MRYLTAREVCDLARISDGTLRRWIGEGRAPEPLKPGSRKRIWPTEQVRDWLENGEPFQAVEVSHE
jgi:excisionase family DNA binding protein